MARLFVSPAEPAQLRTIGETSPLPERYGVDFLWRARGQWFGVQRKELKDFLASVEDARLAKEVAQMRAAAIACPMVICEGNARFTNEGVLLGQWNRGRNPWTYDALFSVFMSVRHEGVQLLNTEDMRTTAGVIEQYVIWSEKEHRTLQTRGGPHNPWGRATNEDWARWFLQGYPGVGPALADAIIEHFGGIPMQWTVTEKELMEVPGIGKERARKLIEVFNA